MEASRIKASSRADKLALRLLESRSFIHSTLSLEYEPVYEPSEPHLAFRQHQAEVVEKEALKVATVEVGTLQALFDTERQSSTSHNFIIFTLNCKHLIVTHKSQQNALIASRVVEHKREQGSTLKLCGGVG